MGPRPRGRGNPDTTDNAVISFRLQWGRDRGNEKKLFVLWCPEGLQWGRDRAVAEMDDPKREPVIAALLQWGRDRAVAEMARCGLGPKSLQSFNGAATARSRKCCGLLPVPQFYALQWGRDRAVAEIMNPPARSTTTSRFNGAATARSRK